MKLTRRTKRNLKKPSEVFRSCPSCSSPNLLKAEGDAFCLYCDWSSIEAHVEARIDAQIHAHFLAQDKTQDRATDRGAA